MILQRLGEKHGTDKAAHGYLGFYERYLEGRDIRSVLEIGVLGGRSLRMWAEYLPDAQIYGLDIEPSCQRVSDDRIKVFTGSQGDRQTIREMAEETGGFDVVIDDGSHVNSLTLKSFQLLWPYTRQLYVIEDLGNSYVDLSYHAPKWPGMLHNKGVNYRNERKDMDLFFTHWIRQVDTASCPTGIHFHHDLAVFER